MVDRGGRRIRHYTRKTDGPGKAERKLNAAAGRGWCRKCEEWLADVRLGLCRFHRNEDYRNRYHTTSLGDSIRRRVTRRRWAAEALPEFAAAYITETFGGRCAYCPEPATTWDHLVAVANGGKTEPGNILPACKRCNSRKRARDPFEFIENQPDVHPALWDRIALAFHLGVLDA